MSESVEIGPATTEDAAELIASARPEDRRETDLAGVTSFENEVRFSVASSPACLAARCGGDLLCLFGAVPASAKEAIVWEIGTVHIRRHVRAFLKASGRIAEAAMTSAPGFERYSNAMPMGPEWRGYRAWAEKYCGAAFENENITSPGGHPFRRFTIRKGG